MRKIACLNDHDKKTVEASLFSQSLPLDTYDGSTPGERDAVFSLELIFIICSWSHTDQLSSKAGI